MNFMNAMLEVCEYSSMRRKAWPKKHYVKVYKRFGDDASVWYIMPEQYYSMLYTPTKQDILADDWEEY